jgi:hypothetical protein
MLNINYKNIIFTDTFEGILNKIIGFSKVQINNELYDAETYTNNPLTVEIYPSQVLLQMKTTIIDISNTVAQHIQTGYKFLAGDGAKLNLATNVNNIIVDGTGKTIAELTALYGIVPLRQLSPFENLLEDRHTFVSDMQEIDTGVDFSYEQALKIYKPLVCKFNDIDNDYLYVKDGLIYFLNPLSAVALTFDKSDITKFTDDARASHPTQWIISEFTQTNINAWSLPIHLGKIVLTTNITVTKFTDLKSIKTYL